MVGTLLTQLKRIRTNLKHLKGYGSFSNMGKDELKVKLNFLFYFYTI